MGKTVIVTGGAGGIGSAVCRGLAQDSLKVIVADLVEQATTRLAEEIRREGGDAIAPGATDTPMARGRSAPAKYTTGQTFFLRTPR